MSFLEERDPLRREVMQRIALAARDLQRKFDQERAIMHANEIGKILNKMFGGK